MKKGAEVATGRREAEIHGGKVELDVAVVLSSSGSIQEETLHISVTAGQTVWCVCACVCVRLCV